MAAQEELRAREQLLDRLAEAIPIGLFQVDTERNVVYTNDRLHAIVGVAARATVAEQLASVARADGRCSSAALERVLGEGLPADIEVELRLPPTASRGSARSACARSATRTGRSAARSPASPTSPTARTCARS